MLMNDTESEEVKEQTVGGVPEAELPTAPAPETEAAGEEKAAE